MWTLPTVVLSAVLVLGCTQASAPGTESQPALTSESSAPVVPSSPPALSPAMAVSETPAKAKAEVEAAAAPQAPNDGNPPPSAPPTAGGSGSGDKSATPEPALGGSPAATGRHDAAVEPPGGGGSREQHSEAGAGGAEPAPSSNQGAAPAPAPAGPPGIIDTVVGTGQSGNNGSEGLALELNVGEPFGVELSPAGELYVTEIDNHRVLKLDPATKRLVVVAGNGKQGYSGDGGPATDAALNEPYEVRFDDLGNMYIVEMKNHLVRRIDANGIIETIAGTGSRGFSGDGGPATAAKLSSPHGIALDGVGGLYIADIGNHRIRKLDLASGQIETIAGNGQRSLPREGQRAKDNPLLGPRAIYFAQDTLWIALREGHSIWSLPIAAGTLHHVAGEGKQGFSGDGGPATSARFDGPKGIAVGPEGHVFVVDTENQAIRKIDPDADRIETVAGSGPDQQGGAGDGGPATAAQLDRPHGIAVATDGTVYIGDTNNHRVRRVNP